MKSKKFISTAKDVINLEIKSLQQLKKKINKSFNDAIMHIAKCQSKVILCGVGKKWTNRFKDSLNFCISWYTIL